MSRLPLVLAIAGVLALSGCGDPVRPDLGTPGTYALRTVDGSPLPYGLGGGRTITFHVVSATLELRGDGTFERAAAISARSAGSDVLVPDPRALDDRQRGGDDAGRGTRRAAAHRARPVRRGRGTHVDGAARR